MTDFVLKIFEYMKAHRTVCAFSFSVFTILLVLSVSRLSYKEDIADFLPVDNEHHNALQVFQNLSGANKVFAIFQYRDSTQTDPDGMVSGVDAFAEEVRKADTKRQISHIQSQVNLEEMAEIVDFVYDNIPYFLSEQDYKRMETALNQPDYAAHQLQQDKQTLMFPTSGFLSGNIQRDPLNLFTPAVQKLQRHENSLKYELYDGHIFSPDMRKAIVLMESPYGSSETENNARLANMLKSCADKVMASNPNLDIHIVGGPIIAVTNASQIKSDSILAVAIAVVLILSLLLFSFRNVRNLLLIALSIAWGWLFAMGGLALFHDKVSIIVIGISSIILGIAVNYPLHFIAHLSHTPNKKKALREIVAPLLVGNITTVGAFLALVPLQSVALRDLGLFSSLLLIGTILFVLVYLPHLSKETQTPKHTLLDKLCNVSLENKSALVWVIIALTMVFGYFSLQTTFDANMGHINYMTDEQKADMAYLQRTMTQSGDYQNVYVLSSDSTLDGALDKSMRLQPLLNNLAKKKEIHAHQGCAPFIVSQTEQEHRLQLWRKFLQRNGEKIKNALRAGMKQEGFADDSFDDFFALLEKKYKPQPLSHFNPLTHSLFASNISSDTESKQYNIIDVLSVKEEGIQKTEALLSSQKYYSFDVVSMNSTIANHLSDDFNYIGFACGFIVFFFLWVSFGSLELALLSFVPMAVSWLWILGIMSLLGIQFNIVNIILATFIFGQGDDYTIFMTEGAMYEYAYRRKMLASYKHSIIISALIMFIGIGTLIVARHPALHSLAEVTIAGMFSVVLMAYVLPPFIFNLLVKTHGGYRLRPLTLGRCCARILYITGLKLQIIGLYAWGYGLFKVLRPTEKRKLLFRQYQQKLFLFDLKHIPRVRFQNLHIDADTLAKPSIYFCESPTLPRLVILLAHYPKALFVVSEASCKSRITRMLLKWNEYFVPSDAHPLLKETLEAYAKKGYGLVLFAENKDKELSPASTYSQDVWTWAKELSLNPVFITTHGMEEILPTGDLQLYPGALTVAAYKLPKPASASIGDALAAGLAKRQELFKSLENADYYHRLVLDRYRYKGAEVLRTVKKRLKQYGNYAQWIDTPDAPASVCILNEGYGEFALLYALVHPGTEVAVYEPDEEKRALLHYCAQGIAPRLQVVESMETALFKHGEPQVFTFKAMADEAAGLAGAKVVSISLPSMN